MTTGFSGTRRLLGGVLMAGLVFAGGCTASSDSELSGSEVFQDPAVPAGGLRLVAFDSCDDAAGKLRAAAIEYLGPWGFGTSSGGIGDVDVPDTAGGADAVDAAQAGPQPAPAGAPQAERAGAPEADGLSQADPAQPDDGHSGTNVHESGVDEPDLVKTDGRRIVTVTRGTLRVVDATRRVVTGTLDLRDNPEVVDWHATDLLLHGDRALVLVRGSGAVWPGQLGVPMPVEPDARSGPAAGPAADPAAGPAVPRPIAGPRLLLVDLAGAPRVLSEYAVDGGLVDARAVEQTARVVVRSAPRLDFPHLDPGVDEEERLAANRQVIETADLADWLPRYEVTSGGRTSTGQVDCTAMSRPGSYTGTSMVTVLTFDLSADKLGDGSPVSVVADGDTVYSNGRSLYVANDQRWRAVPMARGEPVAEMEDVADRTEIYKFDTSEPGPPRYVASGAVDGWLINQYAMSEWQGHLRVATTSGETFWGQESESESTVYVLDQQGDALVETGSVGGLGEGERIYAVRFVGPVGYVVTFRQTDPLYTVDLSDPASPAVLGELKITGYSAYLHPVGDGRVIGVGQEADRQGRIEGTQVSLFDVSDLTDPTLLAQHHIEYGYSEAESDPHAFLWWPAQRLLVVPVAAAGRREAGMPGSGALVLRIGERSVTELELISHQQGSGQIRRSLVTGDTLWTVSDLGLQANDLATLRQTAWFPFT